MVVYSYLRSILHLDTYVKNSVHILQRHLARRQRSVPQPAYTRRSQSTLPTTYLQAVLTELEQGADKARYIDEVHEVVAIWPDRTELDCFPLHLNSILSKVRFTLGF